MIWKLKKHADRRVKSGHPWVFDKEIASTMHGLQPGSYVELQDDQGRFVARGYGNPKSMISFRAMTFNPAEKDFMTRPSVVKRALDAWRSRKHLGFRGSFRLSYSEGDLLPGLVVDYYVGKPANDRIQVFAVQILTAGMNKALGEAETFFKELTDAALKEGLTTIPWDKTAVVLRNDVRSRGLEGLAEEPPRFIKSVREADFTKFPIELNAATDEGLVIMDCDLFLGQKTGFFLDQTANIKTVCELIERDPTLPKDRPVKVLDLCCYVGHWSTQITRTLRKKGHDVEVTQADVSAKALAFARKNAEREGAKVNTLEVDVLKGLASHSETYDIVIADPPAFIKSRKDLKVGQHGYLKMNTQAFRLAKTGGLVACCSCSGLLSEMDFKEALSKSLRRNNTDARCVARGGPAPDHPGRLGFPEGMYLKMFVFQMAFQAGGGAAVVAADADMRDDESIEDAGDDTAAVED